MERATDRPGQTARRDRMIASARRLFVEKGYDGTSLDDVIAEVGGSRRNIYAEFGGKDGLLQAVIHQIIGEIAGAVEARGAETLAPRDWLVEVGVDFVTRMLSPEVIAVFRQFIASGGADPEAAERLWRAGPERFRGALTDWLRRQAAAGTLRVEDPETVARFLPEMMRGGLQEEVLAGRRDGPVDAAEVRAHVEAAVAFALRAMA